MHGLTKVNWVLPVTQVVLTCAVWWTDSSMDIKTLYLAGHATHIQVDNEQRARSMECQWLGGR